MPTSALKIVRETYRTACDGMQLAPLFLLATALYVLPESIFESDHMHLLIIL